MESSYKIDKLDNYIEQIRGISYKSKDISEDSKEGYKVVLRANSIKDNKLILNDLLYVKEELIKEKQFIKCNDILMAASSGSKDIVGKCVQIKDDTEYTFGAFCKLIRCKENINPNYVAYFFRTPYYRATISAVVNGANINNLKNEHIDNLLIPLPSKEIQKRIVDILDKAQELIDKRKEQIEQLDELVKSRFIEMFGDPVKNPKGWEKKKLSDECNIITGNTPSRKIDEYYGDYIEWIKSDNITNAEIYLTTAKEYLSEKGLDVGRSVEANSILMTCIAGSLKCIGNVAIADRKVAFNQQINGIETLENNVYFMFEQFNLSQQYIQSTINMALKGILSKSQLSELEFIFPPLELQNEFAKFFVEVHNVRLNMENSLKELEDNFNSLIQKAFRGELFNIV